MQFLNSVSVYNLTSDFQQRWAFYVPYLNLNLENTFLLKHFKYKKNIYFSQHSITNLEHTLSNKRRHDEATTANIRRIILFSVQTRRHVILRLGIGYSGWGVQNWSCQHFNGGFWSEWRQIIDNVAHVHKHVIITLKV